MINHYISLLVPALRQCHVVASVLPHVQSVLLVADWATESMAHYS